MADPNRFRSTATNGKPDNAHGKLYERHAAKGLAARLQLNSGATAGSKGDMTRRDADRKWLMEVKTTTAETLKVDLGWLVKISEEAYRKGHSPALVFSFVLPSGRPRPNAETEWVAVPKKIWLELTESKNNGLEFPSADSPGEGA